MDSFGGGLRLRRKVLKLGDSPCKAQFIIWRLPEIASAESFAGDCPGTALFRLPGTARPAR